MSSRYQMDSPPHSGPLWPERAASFGMYVFCFGALLGVSVGYAGLILFVVAFFFQPGAVRTLSKDPLFLLSLAFAAYVLSSGIFWYIYGPTAEYGISALETSIAWIKLLFFIPFAYWAAKRPERIELLFLLFIIGFALGFLRKIDWANLDASFFTTRFADHLPALAFGMFSGISVLGLLILRRPIIQLASERGVRGLGILLWILLLALTLEGLILSFSRGSWLAFIVAAMAWMLTAWTRRRRSGDPGQAPKRVLSLLLTGGLLAGLLYLNAGNISDRMTHERSTIHQLLTLDLSGLESSPIGLRIHAWSYGLELWTQRPLFGWGADSSRYWIRHSGRPELQEDGEVWLSDLHNTYFEVLFQFGILGALLFAAMVLVLVVDTARSCRRGEIATELCRFFLAGLVFVLIWNLINHRVTNHDWRFFWIIFAGSAYSFRVRALLDKTRMRVSGETAPKRQ